VFEAAALSLRALACVTRADGVDGAAAVAEASTALERLSAEQLATRLPALWMHGRSRYARGEFERSLRDFEHGSSRAADTGSLTVRLLLTLESVAPLIELGRIRDAIATAEEGLELARLSGNPVIQSGKVRYIGASGMAAWQFSKMTPP
jgi:ATP/maltotriose-dependent transcriptional regulator MalT